MAAIRTRLLEAFRSFSDEFRSRTSDRSGEPENNSQPSDKTPNTDNFDGGIGLDDIKLEFPVQDDESQDEMDDMEDLGHLNTIAAGNVVNIVNSSQVHCGPLHIIYNNGPNDQKKFYGHWAANGFNQEPQQNQTREKGHKRSRSYSSQSSQSYQSASNDQQNTSQSENESIPSRHRPSTCSQRTPEDMTRDVKILMKSEMKPSHKYLKHISWNLGREWKLFFIVLGYKIKIIETFEIDACRAGYSVREARYQLLLDWIGSDDVGTLGKLTAALWEAGETDIVQDLAKIYKKELLYPETMI